MPRKKAIQAPTFDPLVVNEETKQVAAYVAMVVRNELEPFHAKYLADDQVAELNPLLRNAICTALHAYTIGADNDSADGKAFVLRQMRLIPADEEQPRLTTNFVEFVQHRQDRRRDLR